MKAKEMISLNSGRAEFSADMGLEERLEKLTSSEMQTVKGRCTLMDSSSSSDVTCVNKPCSNTCSNTCSDQPHCLRDGCVDCVDIPACFLDGCRDFGSCSWDCWGNMCGAMT